MTTTHGYKAFFRSNDDNFLHSSSSNYSFEIGETYTETNAILCFQGFHYCNNVEDVFRYYPTYAVVCKITDLGETQTSDDKSCTTKIRIDHLLDGNFDGVYFTNGLLNSPDYNTPAIILSWGAKRWYKNGQLHRDNDLPAVEHFNGHKSWYMNGILHRDNGLPAVELSDGRKEWYVNGLLHRDNDLPAVEYLVGDSKTWGRIWYMNGLIHREGCLPAIERANGQKEWWIHGPS